MVELTCPPPLATLVNFVQNHVTSSNFVIESFEAKQTHFRKITFPWMISYGTTLIL